MKNIVLYILILFLSYACNINNTSEKPIQNDTIAKTKVDTLSKNIKPDNLQYYQNSLVGEFKNFKVYNISDTIKADFNGDKVLDFAFFTDKKNISIIDGLSKKAIIVGSDKSFGEMGNDFSWVDFWGTTTDIGTYEIVIDDSEIVGDKKVKLNNYSLFVRKDEVGGGVITFKGNKYIWVHQTE